jgi:hypothetical protein
MSKGNNILVGTHPRGRFEEGILSDTNSSTPKPGTVMEFVRSQTQDGTGRWEWDVFGADAASSNNGVAADGDQRMIAVLLEDSNQGKTADTAYAASTATSKTRLPLYFPIMGEELNMIFENISGTGADQDVAVGDQLIVDNGTGKLLVAAGSDESEPFISMEALTDIMADTLTHVKFTGY